MTDDTSQIEKLMRFLDGTCSESEEQAVNEWLKTDAAARQLLSDLCEQAVSVADLERTHVAAQGGSARFQNVADVPKINKTSSSKRIGKLPMAFGAAAVLLVVGVWVKGMIDPPSSSPILSISGSNSACQILTRFGQLDTQLEHGRFIEPGETLESQCSDSFLKIKVGHHSDITMAGYAYLRQMEQEDGDPLLNFPYGTLWAEIEPETLFKTIRIQTSSAVFEFRKAQFDLQTKRGYSRLRMNEGEALVTRLLDQSSLTIRKGQMIEVTAGDKPLMILDQPRHVQQLHFHQLKGPDILLGETRASLVPGFADIQAVPLPWEVSRKKYIMLYAAAFSVSRSSANPVMLQPGSRIQYRFSYDQQISVRFGFSTQRMQGVFAGKYETDVSPEQMTVNGDTYQVDLSLNDFRPLQANQAASPEGLEINDIYALTIQEDAGLRIHWIEIFPPDL